MSGDKIYEDLSVVVRRANTAFKVLAVALLGILVFYWKVQILDHKKFWNLAETNRNRTRALSAPRGTIRDRNGEILAENKASFKVSLIRENIKDFEASCASVSALLGISTDELKSRIAKYKSVPRFEPIVVKDGLESNEIAPIESRRREYQELVVEAEPKRFYPMGKVASHVLGYLQERTPEEVKANPERGLRLGDMGGKSGVERQYDEILTGREGIIYEVVDSLGRATDELARVLPVQGRELTLTLDSRLQQKAETLLGDREGAIVAMDPQTGEILALASSPAFDPNRFISRFTPQEWLNLTNDPASPLENRAIRGLYAPGSIFKLVMALGGLEFNFVTDQTAVFCNGSIEIYGTKRSCWFAPGHGLMNLAEAIRNSCNIYFYSLGRQMGIDAIALSAERMGLGQITRVDIPGEKEGLVPSTVWKMKTLKVPWYPGETISVAIGQGQLQVTPLQIAALTARIAERGSSPIPRLARSPADPDSSTRAAARQPFKTANFESVIEGMWRSVNASGTGKEAHVEGFDVCGKTGSTQVMSKESAARLARAGKEVKPHSWFSGFAPRVSPRLVVTVLVEFGGGGGATAAPLAGQLFALYKELYHQ